MKGYRTIIFSAFMTLAGMIGWKVSPDTANHWADLFVAIWGICAILLRQVTTTPVGNPAAAPATAALSRDDVVALRDEMLTVLGAVGISPAAASQISDLADRVNAVLDLLPLSTSDQPPISPPADAASPVPAVSALAGDGTAPSSPPAAPAQTAAATQPPASTI